MIQSLVKPGMMNSSDWRYGCSLIRKDRRGFLAGLFFREEIISCTYYFFFKLFNAMETFVFN
jgi:hypothetical protein